MKLLKQRLSLMWQRFYGPGKVQPEDDFCEFVGGECGEAVGHSVRTYRNGKLVKVDLARSPPDRNKKPLSELRLDHSRVK
jgi:hypothetical protein